MTQLGKFKIGDLVYCKYISLIDNIEGVGVVISYLKTYNYNYYKKNIQETNERYSILRDNKLEEWTGYFLESLSDDS